MDKYNNFTVLKQNESEYFIETYDRNSSVTVLAPHGGLIEPHTTDIAKLIAGSSFNCFCFNGAKKNGNNRDLHITSHRYDEDQALILLKKSRTVIAVHGCTEKAPIIYLGGLDRRLRKKIAASFDQFNIPHLQCPDSWPLSGTSPANICNRGKTGRGVQFEISRSLRDDLAAWQLISAAVRSTVKNG